MKPNHILIRTQTDGCQPIAIIRVRENHSETKQATITALQEHFDEDVEIRNFPNDKKDLIRYHNNELSIFMDVNGFSEEVFITPMHIY